MTNRQIEAARIAMTRHIKRGGKVWIKVFPDKSVTKKPAEVRMGSGKGNPEFWVAVVRPGRIMFELAGVDGERDARSAAAGCGQAADRDQDRRARRRGGVGMKRSDLRAMRELTIGELETKARETKEELFNLRFQLRTGHLSDLSQIREIAVPTRKSKRDHRENESMRQQEPMEQPKRRATAAASNRDASFRAQDGQDDRRRQRNARAASVSIKRSSASRGVSRRTTKATTPGSAMSCVSKNAARFRKRSAGACSRSWSARDDSARDAAQVSPTTPARASCCASTSPAAAGIRMHRSATSSSER